MLISFLQKNKYLRNKIYRAGRTRALDMIDKTERFLQKSDKILDLGCGTCNVCEILTEKGYHITPLDVQDLSFVNNLKPVIYDGHKIPYGNNEFDKTLIFTVLHHTRKPEKILAEAMRVSKSLIIIEDIYTNRPHKILTCFLDSLLNLEFLGHPHTNKSDVEWQETFRNMHLKLIDVKFNNSFLSLKHVTYYLKK